MILVQWTSADLDEAGRICRALVEQGLVACANIIPSVESIYTWEGNLETSTEAKVHLKAPAKNFSRIEDYIVTHCSYDVPEILAFAPTDGHKPYIDWVEQD